MRHLGTSLARLAIVALLAGAPRAAQAIGVGQLAPDFSLMDVGGSAHRLSDLRGNLVLLAFVGYG